MFQNKQGCGKKNSAYSILSVVTHFILSAIFKVNRFENFNLKMYMLNKENIRKPKDVKLFFNQKYELLIKKIIVVRKDYVGKS